MIIKKNLKGLKAMDETEQCTKVLRIGNIAPNFSARSTLGDQQLADFRGQWLIFFSHPADFTPVCTTEFVALAKLSSEFEKANCSLLGLSVDSLYAHLAWVRAIEKKYQVEINFPILEDPSMTIGRAYGMIDDETADSSTMRSSFFIDPDGIIRAITTYPYNIGRSAQEMLRLIQALQAAGESGNFAPENWHPGDNMLQPPAENVDAVHQGDDWFCKEEVKK